jgi:hypothetical protein
MSVSIGGMHASNITHLVEKLSAKREEVLLEQLNELVARGLLVVELGPMTLVQEFNGQVGVRQEVRLVLKNQEYVESLEKKVADLETRLENIRAAIAEASE